MEELTFSEIISYAKIAEDNAKKFYLDAARIANLSHVKEFLKSLADEEQGHSDRLDALQKNLNKKGVVPKVHEAIHTFGYTDYIKPVDHLDQDATYKDVLEVGMAKEKEAIQSYEKFSLYVDDTEAKKLFNLLAQEEKKHLKRFEEEYDDLQDQKY
ncbi:MAG: ferritin family protein [bacterium]